MEVKFKPIKKSAIIAEALEMGLDVPITLTVENYSKVVIKDSDNDVIGYLDDFVAEVLKHDNNIEGHIYGYSRLGANINNFFVKC